MTEIPQRSKDHQELISELDNLLKLTHVLVNMPTADGGTIQTWMTLEELAKSGRPTALEESVKTQIQDRDTKWEQL